MGGIFTMRQCPDPALMLKGTTPCAGVAVRDHAETRRPAGGTR